MLGSPGIAGGVDSTQFAHCRMHLRSFGRDLWDQHYGVYPISLVGLDSVCERLGSVWVRYGINLAWVWQDPAQRRSLINFVHFVFQLTQDVTWIVAKLDLDSIGGQDKVTTLGDAGRHMDLQISMKASGEDDCTMVGEYMAQLQVEDETSYRGAQRMK